MRGGQNVFTRLSIVAVVCAMSVGVAAQQAVPQDPAGEAQLDKARAEVRTFEIVLFRTIETAGQKLAAWAQQVVPQTILVPTADPVVNGFPVADAGFVFMVRIAELSGVTVFNSYERFFQQAPMVVPPAEVGAGGARPVSTSGPPTTADGKPAEARPDGKVTSSGVIADDPMKSNPASRPKPDVMYSDLVRLGLMDAMLDSSIVLTLKDGQSLSVTVVPVDSMMTNSLYRNTSRKLILSIKAEDLALFRAGKITRDEAKLKIVDTRF